MSEATGTIEIRSAVDAFLLKTALNVLYGLAPVMGLSASEETANRFDEIGNHFSEQIHSSVSESEMEEWLQNDTEEMQQLLGKANRAAEVAREAWLSGMAQVF